MTSQELKTCLQNVDISTLVKGALEGKGFNLEGEFKFKGPPYSLIQDDFASKPFLGKFTLTELEDPKTFANDVPLLMGSNKDEGLMFMVPFATDREAKIQQALNNHDFITLQLVFGL